MKGRKIEPPKDFTGRPTTDFAREGLFNLLFNRKEIEGAKVLDLYAGSGAIGFEFVSRGAAEVVSVDSDANVVKFIKKKSEDFNTPQIKPVRFDAISYLSRNAGQFDIIFCDPPFDKENLDEIPRLVFDNNLLAADGMLILEHEDIHSFEEHPRFLEVRKYGRIKFSFFGKE